MKKILIAIDYHPTAETVATFGYTIAKTLHAEVILLHVLADRMFYASSIYDPIMGFGGYTDLQTTDLEITKNLKESSYTFLESIKSHLGDDNIESIVKEGNCADTIIETAKKLGAGMIVMGSHSQKWLEHWLVGSQTEKVLQHIFIPLYVIPTKK